MKYKYFIFIPIVSFCLFTADRLFAVSDDCVDCTVNTEEENTATPPASPTPGPAKISSTVLENKKIVNDCLENATSTDSEIQVSSKIDLLCKKGDLDADPVIPEIRKQAPVSYRISKRSSDSKIVINIKVALNIKSKNQTRIKQIFNSTKACLTDINYYFNTYGMEFKADFLLPTNAGFKKAEANIIIDDDLGWSNSREYHYKGLLMPTANDDVPPITMENNQPKANMAPTQGCLWICRKKGMGILNANSCDSVCEEVRAKEYCNMMTHELGHLMGLVDEYQVPGCPDYPQDLVSHESKPASVMARPHDGLFDGTSNELATTLGNLGGTTEIVTTDLTNLLGKTINLPNVESDFSNQVEFMPRHIRQITAPLCTSKKID